MLERQAPHIAPIIAQARAWLGAGAIIDVEQAPIKHFGTEADYTPDPEQAFLILEVAGGSITNDGVRLDPHDEADWQLEFIDSALYVRYCPGTAGSPSCDGSV